MSRRTSRPPAPKMRRVFVPAKRATGFAFASLPSLERSSSAITTFYGVSLGVGSGATLVMSSVFTNSGLLQSPDVPALVGGLLLFGLSLTFVLASTGAIIGFGASQGKVLGYYVRAFLVRFSHLAILMFFFLYDPGDNPAAPKDPTAAILSLAASLVFAGIVYAFVYREVLPETLPKDIRRELLRWPGKAERPAKESE